MQEIKKYENEHRESQNGQVSQVDFDLWLPSHVSCLITALSVSVFVSKNVYHFL